MTILIPYVGLGQFVEYIIEENVSNPFTLNTTWIRLIVVRFDLTKEIIPEILKNRESSGHEMGQISFLIFKSIDPGDRHSLEPTDACTSVNASAFATENPSAGCSQEDDFGLGKKCSQLLAQSVEPLQQHFSGQFLLVANRLNIRHRLDPSSRVVPKSEKC